MTFDYVLYEISYVNVLMYSRVLPSYDSDRNDEAKTSDDKKVISDKNPQEFNEFFKNLNKGKNGNGIRRRR